MPPHVGQPCCDAVDPDDPRAPRSAQRLRLPAAARRPPSGRPMAQDRGHARRGPGRAPRHPPRGIEGAVLFSGAVLASGPDDLYLLGKGHLDRPSM